MIPLPTLADMRDRVRHARAITDRDLREALVASVMADAIGLAIASGNLGGSYTAMVRPGFEHHEGFRLRDSAMDIAQARLVRRTRPEPAPLEPALSLALAREFGLTASGPHGDEPPPRPPRAAGLAEMVERIGRVLAGAAVVFGIVPAALLLILP